MLRGTPLPRICHGGTPEKMNPVKAKLSPLYGAERNQGKKNTQTSNIRREDNVHHQPLTSKCCFDCIHAILAHVHRSLTIVVFWGGGGTKMDTETWMMVLTMITQGTNVKTMQIVTLLRTRFPKSPTVRTAMRRCSTSAASLRKAANINPV